MDAATRYMIEVECGALPLLYAKYSDNGDHAALASLFAADAAYVRPFQADDPVLGRERIHAMFRDRAPTLARHIVTNVLVEAIDEHRARGTNYLTVLSSNAGIEPPQESGALYVGECDDEYVKTDEGWKFARRAGMIALHIAGGSPGAGPTRAPSSGAT